MLDYAPSDIVYVKFATVRPSTGAPFALSGGTVSVYKDNSTTQTATGVSLTADFDGVTGLNHVTIDTSTDGTFYSAGSSFQVVITAGTVDSVSVVGQVVGEFTLNRASVLRPTTAGRTLDVSSGGEAGIDLANVGSPTTTLNLSGTTISASQAVASVSGAVGSVTGAVGSVTGNVGGNVTGSVASVANYGTLVSDIASAVWGAGTRSLTTFGTLASDVWAVATRTLTESSDSSGVTTLLSRIVGTLASGTHNAQSGDSFARLGAPAGASIAADIAGISGGGGLDAAGVRAAIGLATANLDTQLAAIDSKTTSLPSDPADQSLVIAATDAILARLPSALVSGRMDVSVGAMAANVITASAMASTAIDEIRNGTSSITISRSGQTDVTYTEVRS